MKPIVALALNNDAIRAAVIANPYTNSPTLRKIITVHLPVGAVADGEVVDGKVVTGILKNLIKHHEIPRSEALLVYSSRRMIYREASFPRMSLAELRETLRFQTKSIIPLPLDDCVMDFVPLSIEQTDQGEKYHGMVVASLRAGVEKSAKSIEDAGLKVAAIDAAAFSLSRVFDNASHDNVPAVINVGSNSTDVIILHEGRPVYLRSVPSGADDVTTAIVSALDIEFEDADEIKQRIGLRNVTGDPRLEKAEETIRDTTAQLIVGVRNTLNYYSAEHPGTPVGSILLTGVGSALGDFPNVLAVSTSLPVSMGDPFSRFALSKSIRDEDLHTQAAGFAAVLGLALGRKGE